MGEILGAQLAALDADVWAAEVPGDWRPTAAWCLGRLPALYDKLCRTSESRYTEEITRLVQALLTALRAGGAASPGSERLAAGITGRLRLLHEQLGLPALGLKQPKAAVATRTRKVN